MQLSKNLPVLGPMVMDIKPIKYVREKIVWPYGYKIVTQPGCACQNEMLQLFTTSQKFVL